MMDILRLEKSKSSNSAIHFRAQDDDWIVRFLLNESRVEINPKYDLDEAARKFLEIVNQHAAAQGARL